MPDDVILIADDDSAIRTVLNQALGRAGYTAADLQRLTFPGQNHSAASWAARISIPLQLLFPAVAQLDEAPPGARAANPGA